MTIEVHMASVYEAGSYGSGALPERDGGLALFARTFVRHPSMVGTAVPGSRYMVRHMLDSIVWEGIDTFVEYGPGTGAFTREILKRLHGDAKLLAIDTGVEFVSHLRQSLRDRRLRAITASAADVGGIMAHLGLGKADCILSGLPFSNLSAPEAGRIMDSTVSAMNPDGMFCAYQMRSTIEPLMAARFRSVRSAWEWRNVPPCRLYWASGARAV